MSEHKSIDFKFRFRKPTSVWGESEYYRASLDEATGRDFARLSEKMAELMPKLRERSFVLTWTDSDGDEVTVADDESLGIALSQANGPLYR